MEIPKEATSSDLEQRLPTQWGFQTKGSEVNHGVHAYVASCVGATVWLATTSIAMGAASGGILVGMSLAKMSWNDIAPRRLSRKMGASSAAAPRRHAVMSIRPRPRPVFRPVVAGDGS
ncbi:MAG: hypothetical protein R3B72_28020 [Polyangiaceae bacterium]